ncbi:MAG: isopeptide-forming domain-containing fimbrial protein [Actinomycetia bacterium]|nr:isopeptide-forming domain-containing fimbrial protein [Actinomycetes bacterium]
MKKLNLDVLKTLRKRLALALAGVLLFGTLPLVPGLIPISSAAPAPAQVINNYPTAITPGQLTATKAISLNQMDWSRKAYHSFYDNTKGISPAVKSSAQAYVTKTSQQFNGTATPDHVVLSKDSLRFLGYGAYSNLDLLYTDAYSSFETLDFTLKPKQIKFHTLNQSGFLFNGSFSGANNAYYTGYALLIDVTTQSQGKTKGTASLKLVYMQNQLFTTTGNNTFPAAGLTFTTQDVIMPSIVEGATPDFQVQLAKTTTGFSLYVDGNLVREIDPAAGSSLPGFGFFAGYFSHSCKALTVVEYSNLKIAVKIAPAQTSPQVKFIDKDTGAEIADAQTTPSNATVSYVGDEFWVDPSGVQTIMANGTTYSYVSSAPSNLAHITYRAGGGAANAVTLYYKDAALLPEKHASINGGTSWDATGTASDPVNVNQGDIIDYKIDVKVPQEFSTPPKPIRFVGVTTNDTPSADIRPLSAIVSSNNFYSYPTAVSASAAKPYDATSYPPLYNRTVNGSLFNVVNTICRDGGGSTAHTNCIGSGDNHNFAPYMTSAGMTASNLNACYEPAELAPFTNTSTSPYITSWYTNRLTSQYGFPAGTSRAFENTLWLKAPKLPAGKYNVSVKASVDFRMHDGDDTRYTPRDNEKHTNQTYTFNGVAMNASDYDAFLATHPKTTLSPYTTAANSFGYMGAGRNASVFPDNFLTYPASGSINTPFSVSWNTNNLASGGTAAHTATTVNAYTATTDRNNAYQMMANGTAFTYRGNANPAADTTYQQLTKSGPIEITNDNPDGMVGLDLTAAMTLATYSSDSDASDRLASTIRVYEVMYTPVGHPYTVTDLLPAGLKYVPGSMTTDLDPAYTTSPAMTFSEPPALQTPDGEDVARDLLTWNFAGLPAGTTTLRFKAQVTTDSGVFENKASVTNKDAAIPTPDVTNSTWHATAVAKVTEKYQNYLNPGTALQGDTYDWLPDGGGYGVAPALRNPIDTGGKTYRYYGYSPDGGQTIITDSLPPDGQPLTDATDDSGAPLAADYLWDHVYGTDSEVILYFVPDVQVLITSVDYTNPGTALKTTLDYNVSGYTPYLMSPVQLNSLGQYNYINRYKLDGSAESTGVPAAPVYSANQMATDHAITLYFATDPQITLKFVVDGNEAHILKNPVTDTLLFGTDYDPAKSANQPLPTRITDPLTGAVYEFSGYKLDNGTTVPAADLSDLAIIPAVEANHAYTLLYARTAAPPQKNAYINGASGAQNGAEGRPVSVKLNDQITYKVTLGSSWSGPPRVASPTFQPPGGATQPQHLNFVNGSFETPVTPANIMATNVPGWTNTAENVIEIQHVGTNVTFAPIAPDGVQYAELNANTAGTLYQTVPTIPGTKVYWEFYHGARGVNLAPAVNTDVMDFLLGSSTTNLTQQVRATDSWTRGTLYVWGHYYGEYIVPAGQTSTVFAFRSISAAGGTTQGNYLDGVRLYTSSYVELAKSNDAPGGGASIGDTVTYTVKAQNNGEADAKNAQVFDTLPAGTELVPGSVAIDGVPTSSYNYNPSTRALNVNVGYGATTTTGGLLKGVGSFSIDCNNAYTITFKVKVTSDALAANGLYENQSKVTFSDRPDTAASPSVYTNYSNVSSFGFVMPANTITDVVPAGLEVDETSISDGGVYDAATRTITWLLSGNSPADTTVSFNTAVSTPGEYDNTATITLGNATTEETDTTYHQYIAAEAPPQKNAYINGGLQAQNGEEGQPVSVKLDDQITYQVTLGSIWSGPTRTTSPRFQPVGGTEKPPHLNFINGSFETPVTSTNIQASSAEVPGWKNTAEDLIEIQHVGTDAQFAPSAPDGTQYAELNARTAGTLYQAVPTIPGTKVYWEFYHGARGAKAAPSANTDVMDFLLGSSTTNLTQQVRASDSWTVGQPYVWGHYFGAYTVPAGQTSTMFAFQSVSSTSGNLTQGNYLDGIRLYTSSYVELTKSNDASGGKASVGDIVTYTVKAQNNGESDSKNTQVFDTLPAGTELVPNTVAIDGVSTSNYSYNTSTRGLWVNVGSGATSSAGGLIKGVGSFSTDCNNAYAITFQVKVVRDAIAANLQYQNQSKVTFSDRPDTAASPSVYTNYSNVSSFGFTLPVNTITDVVPAGLEVDEASISDGGVYDKNTRTITWQLPGNSPADTVVFFNTVVSVPGKYANTAAITLGDGTTEKTDTTYHRYAVEYALHLRQVVLDYDGSVALPSTGYFVLENTEAPDKRYSVTTDSNSYGIEVPFRSIDATTAAGMVYTIQDILPQCYDYAGYTATSFYAPGAHTDIPASTGLPQIDFAAGNELWVTVYIRPGSAPGKYDWDAKTNDFGTIYPTP